MKIKLYHRILILPVLVLLWSILLPSAASAQDSFVISETKYINNKNEPAGDKFGYGVAIDGSMLVVGAPYDDGNPDEVGRADNQGAAHPFQYTEGSVFPQTKLTEKSDIERDDRFGNSLGISGDTVVIGAYRDDLVTTDSEGVDIVVADSGAAYVAVYDEIEEAWKIDQNFKLTGDSVARTEFGYAVAISGDVVVVGAHKDNDKGRYAGAVYVFRNNGSLWVREDKLYPTEPQEGERFGSSVAIDGDTIVVGAIYGGDGDISAGSAYVFEYDDSAWVQVAKLMASPGVDDAKFGYAVAIEGDTIIVGAPRHNDGVDVSGAAYVFRRGDDGTWNQPATKLIGSNLSADARFGNSVAISGNTAVVGAHKDDVLDVNDNPLVDVGSVYVFRFDGSKWPEEVKLFPSTDGFPDDSVDGDEFGYAVAISGDLVLVGAHEDDVLDENDNLQKDAGSVYVFTLTPENQPPVAIVGEDQEVEEGSLVTLLGSESYDPDGDDLSYVWTQIGGSGVALDDPTKVEPTFTAPALSAENNTLALSAENETLTFQLVVNDGSEDSDPAVVKITVLQSTKNVTEINAFLGSRNRPWGLDKDMFAFNGTKGDRVTVTLRAKPGGKNNGGNRATLKLMDNIEGVRFKKMVSGRLPSKICATLPATGQYRVLVAGQPRFFKGKRFLGEYTISLEGASGSLVEDAGDSVVPKKSGCSTKPHKNHSIWSWLFSRFRR